MALWYFAIPTLGLKKKKKLHFWENSLSNPDFLLFLYEKYCPGHLFNTKKFS
jgi:hypothetical protein